VADRAIIFDVDGVLLELSRDEEDIFFSALSKFVPVEHLSRDWNSYKIRNDENIIAEILERNNLSSDLTSDVAEHYIQLLQTSSIKAVEIAGATELLRALNGKASLGIATANLLQAAKHRLQHLNLWHFVSDHASGADGGGHKSDILGRAIAGFRQKPERIIFIGDNLNDVAAGVHHNVDFIGFSESAERRKTLQNAGAKLIAGTHAETFEFLQKLLA
jgi:HAD superfamily hydrolase (TIGR01549 family)